MNGSTSSDSASVPNYQLELITKSGTVTMNLLGEWLPVTRASEEVAAFLASADERELRLTLTPTGGFIWIRRGGTLIALLGLGAVVAVPLRLARRLSRGTSRRDELDGYPCTKKTE